MSVTIKDIARHLGISVTQVSRALGGYDDVAETTRQRVLVAAREMGYEPNVMARGLRSQRAGAIGLTLPSQADRLHDPYIIEFLAGVGDAATEGGLDLLVATMHDGTEEQVYRRLARGGRVDGLILFRTRQHDTRIDYLLEEHIPFVAFGRTAREQEFPYVDVDGVRAGYEATRHLLELGHRRIAHIAAPLDLMFAEYRRQGYRQALVEAGLPSDPALEIEGDLTGEGGQQAMVTLLDRAPDLTAVFAANDLMALGVMREAAERGQTVGRDLSVVGFDDIQMAAHANPPLTTMHQPVYEIGQRVCQMLLHILNDKHLGEEQIVLPAKLVVRASTGPPMNET